MKVYTITVTLNENARLPGIDRWMLRTAKGVYVSATQALPIVTTDLEGELRTLDFTVIDALRLETAEICPDHSINKTESMREYLGIKRIKACPMNRQEYNDYRNWTLPNDENGEDPGYLVEYLDSPNSNHPNHEGYISWSPKDVFEKAYKVADKLTFGEALEALKAGMKITRKGWNGKGMFLFLLPAGIIPKSAIHDPNLRDVLQDSGKDSFEALASIRMKTADNKILTGWLASQTDMLAEDWVIVS